MRVLVVNAGSSSLKLRLMDSDDAVLWGENAAAPAELSDEELVDLLDKAPEADAVGHRVVHGGASFTGPTLIDDDVAHDLEQLSVLAPLHQPPALRLLDAVRQARTDLPNVACFDTSFHRTLPPAAEAYALPATWRGRYPLRRYGFHGLSHAWAAHRVVELAAADVPRIVCCHLGAGCSLAAISDGRCVDTTMGFTPLEGLVMATRSGDVDPGLVLWLIRQAGMSPEEVERGLVHDSGLLGLAGHADMRTVLNLADAGEESARLAVAIYLHRLRARIAGMCASLGGIDALVFTGGVGEHAWQIRSGAVESLDFLGVFVDPASNRTAAPDAEVTAVGSPVRSFVLEAREDLEIARATRRLLTV